MATSALPTAESGARVRVRSLAIALGMLAVLATIAYALHWASAMRPLSGGATTAGPLGLGLQAHTRDAWDTGPATWRWRRDGRYVVVLSLTNTASVPVTLTGVTH